MSNQATSAAKGPDLPLKKTVRRAFGKEVYLLGRFTDGYTFWLEAPAWECDWYWSVGYIETYTNREGPPARDIQSHQHYNSLLFCKPTRYDSAKQAWVVGDKYLHILSDHPDVLETVLTKQEEWVLSDLLQMAYTLRRAAEVYRHGTAYLTAHALTPELRRPDREREINEVELPRIFAAIRALLVPKEEPTAA